MFFLCKKTARRSWHGLVLLSSLMAEEALVGKSFKIGEVGGPVWFPVFGGIVGI